MRKNKPIIRYIVRMASGRYARSDGSGDTVVEGRADATRYSYDAALRRCVYGATMEEDQHEPE